MITQLSSRYSPRLLDDFFDIPTICYVLLFIGTIFLAFGFLSKPSPRAVKFSLAFGAACLLILIPFFLSFRDRLNPENIIDDLKRDAVSQLSASPRSEPEMILITIDNTMMAAFAFKDYGTFEKGADALRDIVVAETEQIDNPVALTVLNRLLVIGISTIDDTRAPTLIAESLGQTGADILKERPDDVTITHWVAAFLKSITDAAAEKKLEGLVIASTQQLWDFGVRATLKANDALKESVTNPVCKFPCCYETMSENT